MAIQSASRCHGEDGLPCSRPRHPSRRHNGLAPRQASTPGLSLGWICRELSGPSWRQRTRHNRPDYRQAQGNHLSVWNQRRAFGSTCRSHDIEPSAASDRAETATTSAVVLPDVHTVPVVEAGRCAVPINETSPIGCASVFTGPASRVSWIHRPLRLSQPVAEGTLDEGACTGSPDAPVTTPEQI